jgi:hypothetical protein
LGEFTLSASSRLRFRQFWMPHWEDDFERTPQPNFTLYIDSTRVVRNDPITDRQAQTSAFAIRLCGKEGVENSGQVFGWDARPGVLDGNCGIGIRLAQVYA